MFQHIYQYQSVFLNTDHYMYKYIIVYILLYRKLLLLLQHMYRISVCSSIYLYLENLQTYMIYWSLPLTNHMFHMQYLKYDPTKKNKGRSFRKQRFIYIAHRMVKINMKTVMMPPYGRQYKWGWLFI